MKRLTAQLKQALAALAYADAGEMLPGTDKTRVLAASRLPVSAGVPAKPPAPSPGPRPPAAVPPVSTLFAGRKQVGLYLGAALDPEVLRYAAETCQQLDAALTVITFQADDDARSLLAPYLDGLGRAGVVWRIARLSGEPRASLVRFLKGEPRMLFLVATEAGFLGQTLLSGAGRRVDLGLPIVLVATEKPASGPELPLAIGH
ncbi:MAG: hypothetical protein MUF66_10185 [Gammaproteobacteria bacterium]|jgi:hypothetical protein|nr:hypothetical protein [Gammaproteobacteria bacterium]